MSDSNQISSRVTTLPRREITAVHDDSALGYLMDTGRFEHMQRLAQLMACASLTPKHLKGQNDQESLGNCFRVANQAVRWGFDPFAIMDETYVVHGRLGYQGKLVAGVINARAGLAERLVYKFDGQGIKRTITVIGRFQNESTPRDITLSVEQAQTANEMWKKDPDQKLVYSGVTKWARRHCPEIMLGIMTDDELEAMKPTVAEVTENIKAKLKLPAEPIPVKAEPAPEPPKSETKAPVAETPKETPTPEREPGVEDETPPLATGELSADESAAADREDAAAVLAGKLVECDTADSVKALMTPENRAAIGETLWIQFVQAAQARINRCNRKAGDQKGGKK